MGLLSRCGVLASRGSGFSCCRARALECGLSSCGSQALEQRLNSCGTRAWLLCGMWDLPRSGIKPMSPALAGGFFTTEPPRKPYLFISFVHFSFQLSVLLICRIYIIYMCILYFCKKKKSNANIPSHSMVSLFTLLMVFLVKSDSYI